jgi:translocation and assembly module TamB
MTTRTTAQRARRIALFAALLLVVVTVVCVVMLLRAPIAASFAQRFLPGLTVDGAEGWLLSTGTYKRVRYTTADMTIDIDSVYVEVESISYFPPSIRLAALRARKVDVELKGTSKEPAKPPASLAPPFEVDVRALSIAELNVRRPDSAPANIRDIDARFKADARTIQVEHIAVQHPDARVRARGSLGTGSPFALKADADANGKTGEYVWEATVKAEGTLLALSANAAVTAKGNGPEGRAVLNARVEPFKPQPLIQADATVNDVDIQAWVPAAPRTQLTGQATLAPVAAGYAGTLRIENKDAGTLDKQRLPVRLLTSSYQLDREGNAQLSDLKVDAAKAGRLQGSGRWQTNAGTLALQLDLANVDLRAWHASLVSTKLQGPVALNLGRDAQTAKLDVKDAQLAATGEVTLANRVAGGQLKLSGAKLGEAEGKFEVALSGNEAFTATGSLARVNIAALGASGRFPQSRLNGKFAVMGQMKPTRQGALQLDLADSTLADRPFTAKGDVRIVGDVVERGNVSANLAGNLLTAQGGFGAANSTLRWTLDAPNLATLGKTFAGALRGQGTLAGTLSQPTLDATLTGTRLRLPGEVRIENIDLTAKVATAREAPLALTANIRKLNANHRELVDQLDLRVEGTGAAHTLRVTAKNPKWDVEAGTRGGFGEYWSWAGQLTTLNVRGPINANLVRPANLLFGGERQRIDSAVFDVGGGELVLEALDRTATTIDSRGTVSRFPVTALFPLMDPAITGLFASTLRLKGGWDVNWVDLPNVRANIQREDGDLTLKSTPPFAFGLNQFSLTADSANRMVKTSVNVQGSAAGKLMLALSLPINLSEESLEIDRTKPLDGRIDVQLPSIRWVGPWLGPAHDVDGLLTADMKLGGTWPNIRPNGRIAGANIRYAHLTEGINFTDGELAASMANNVVTLDQFTLRGGQGTFDASGRLELDESNPSGGADWKAEKLHLLNLVDRSVVASGEGRLVLKDKQLALTGKLRADSGRIVLADSSSPTLSDDVIVLGRDTNNSNAAKARPLALDLDLNLGNDFALLGRGLDVRLGGRLQVSSTPGNPLRTTGTLRSRTGTYKAYGQDLVIQRAVVSFNGRIDNPSLDILAERKDSPVEVGVNIGGTAEKPVLRLVSNPEMPDGEKLSWLVLGRGSDGMDQSDKGAMQAAARTLLAQGAAASLAGTLANTLGVDEIALGTSSSTTAAPGTDPVMVVTVGKRLSSRASIMYEQGLNGANALVKLTYQLSRLWRVQLVTGSENAVDVFYRLAFD